MSNKKLIRFIAFTCTHYFPLIILWLIWMCSYVYVAVGTIMFYMAVSGIPILFGIAGAYWVWIKYSSWIMRFLAIDCIWCLIFIPILFYIGRMGLGGEGITQRDALNYGMIVFIFLLQIFIVPWTFFSMWLMKTIDKKWFELA